MSFLLRLFEVGSDSSYLTNGVQRSSTEMIGQMYEDEAVTNLV